MTTDLPTTRKFGLKRALDKLSARDSRNKRRQLAGHMGVSLGRVNQLIYAREGSNTTMSGDQILVASQVLECSAEEILRPYEEQDSGI